MTDDPSRPEGPDDRDEGESGGRDHLSADEHRRFDELTRTLRDGDRRRLGRRSGRPTGGGAWWWLLAAAGLALVFATLITAPLIVPVIGLVAAVVGAHEGSRRMDSRRIGRIARRDR